MQVRASCEPGSAFRHAYSSWIRALITGVGGVAIACEPMLGLAFQIVTGVAVQRSSAFVVVSYALFLARRVTDSRSQQP